ncbi:MAG: sulfite exporter TauE/SafE family protein, partial [Oscillospiraceae bacterium]|nr:sulfite exporter TauE/SafE family protein [Oscillospiraceae bacterium]
MKLSQKMKCAVAGLLAGAANGLFGAGGGMFIIPLYTRWVKLEQRRAYASSVAAVLPICAVSAAVYLLRGGTAFRDALPYMVWESKARDAWQQR